VKVDSKKEQCGGHARVMQMDGKWLGMRFALTWLNTRITEHKPTRSESPYE
jgi:hypothetical protein